MYRCPAILVLHVEVALGLGVEVPNGIDVSFLCTEVYGGGTWVVVSKTLLLSHRQSDYIYDSGALTISSHLIQVFFCFRVQHF